MTARKKQSIPRRGRGRSNMGVFVLAGAVVFAALLIRGRDRAPAAEVTRERVVAEFDTVAIPVPLDPVPAGTKIKSIPVREVQFPKHQLPQGALADLTPYAENVTRVALPANLPIFADNLAASQFSSNPVVERIPPGMRAMTVRVDATSAVEGWARSGSVVDVLLVEDNQTTVVAEKVRILSAERSVEALEAESPAVPSTVTLLVTQEQCLAINTAIPLGRIAFALRGVADGDSWQSDTFSAELLRSRGLGEAKGGVQGFVEVQGGDGAERFALSQGRWVRSETIPEGFLAAREVSR
ncbi:MAG: Flp pilus assembly protein CpaB [Bdellovibrionota bacterium]|nr:MAG: Flp pilus assembly protein CpaB [Bdellovibrionota bacterium]